MPNTGDAYKQSKLSQLLMKTFIMRNKFHCSEANINPRATLASLDADIITLLVN